MLKSFVNVNTDSRNKLVLLLLTSFLAVVLGFYTFNAIEGLKIVHRIGYYWMLLTAGAFGYALIKIYRPIFIFKSTQTNKVWLLILSLSVWMHLSEPHEFKIINDELQLASTAQRMHYLRESSVVARGYYLGSDYTIMQGVMDKRPLFFPFLVSIVHDVAGYRPENSFILNGVLTPILLGLLYLVVARVAGAWAGLGAIFIFSTIPLVVQTVTGGGFEVLNMVMVLAVIILGMDYLNLPSAPNLNAFCLAGVLLAQVRYESVLFIFPIIVIVIYGWIRSKIIVVSWALLASPLLLLLYPLQYKITDVMPGLLQLADRPSAHGIYSICYFYDNLGRAVDYFISFSRLQSNSHLVFLCGAVGLGFMIIHIFGLVRKRIEVSACDIVFYIFIFSLFLQGFLMLCYFWGAYNDVLTVRLSLPTQLVMVLIFCFVFGHLFKAQRAWQIMVISTCFYGMAWTMPTIAARGYKNSNQAATTVAWCRNYIKTRPDRNYLVLDGTARLWGLYGISTLTNSVVADQIDGFLYHYHQGTFGDILVVQRLRLVDASTGAMEPIASEDLGKGVSLETLQTQRMSPTLVTRLSRVTKINDLEMKEWALARKSMNFHKLENNLSETEELKFSSEWMQRLP